MSKEVIPPTFKELTPPNGKAPIQKSAPKNITTKPALKKVEYKTAPKPQEKTRRLKPIYKYAGKESLNETVRKSIPKQFIPTSRFASILGLMFLAVVIFALTQFPFEKLLSGNTDIIINIGYPWPFLKIELLNPNTPPLRPIGLFLDLALYLIISYGIDVIINIISDAKIIKSKKELRGQAKIFKNAKPTIADKVTKKIFNTKTNLKP